MTRTFYLALGWFLVLLGVIGAILPIMPSTVFMIAAALCFGRGSPRARAWLLNHRWFGPPIVKWEKNGGISRPTKLFACVCMAGSLAMAMFLEMPLWVVAMQAVALFSAAAFILSRPD